MYNDFIIDQIQLSKKQWINTFIWHEDIKTAMTNFVDGQTSYTKSAIQAAKDFTAGLSKVLYNT